MYIVKIILGSVLLAQTSDGILRSPPGAEKRSPAVLEPAIHAGGAASEAPLPVGNIPAANRIQPPEMVAAAIMLPPGSTLSGQPLTLVSVLSSTPDRRQQLEMTRVYWSLAQSVAEYHYCFDHAQELAKLKPSGSETASLRLAQASAAAMLRQTELEATRAQYELAKAMRLPVGAALPLPADRPHVGPYRTSFQELFAGRTAPEPAALMDRTLPIRRQAVDEQAAAVQAAEDVQAAVAETHSAGGDLTATIASSETLLEQRRAFIRAVCDYNRSIAEYGLAVASPMASPQALVAILIGPAQQGTAPAIATDVQGSVRPASASVPATSDANTWRATEPTTAPPRGGLQPLGQNTPTLAPPQDTLQPGRYNEPTPAPPGDVVQPPRGQQPAAPPPNERAGKMQAVPIESLHAPNSSSQPRTANRLALSANAALSNSAGGNSSTGSSLLYPALLDAAPAAQAKQLTVALYWDRSLPEGLGKPLSLVDCLLRDPGADRRATIDAYWLLRQRAAEYQVLAQQAELLDDLLPAVLERRNDPAGPTDMLRLRLAQLSAQASMREAHAALIEAQYSLAQHIGATGDAAWPLASTLPHWGNYLLKLDSQPKAVVDSWPVRRLTVTIPTLFESVLQHASAVVEADAARAAAVEKYQSGSGSIALVIDGVATQTKQTLSILKTLTDYNQSIADYVLTVLPPTTPADRLVTALVLKP